MSKIIIFGFPHCGTTILKTIIGHIDNVDEVIGEIYSNNKEKHEYTDDEIKNGIYKCSKGNYANKYVDDNVINKDLINAYTLSPNKFIVCKTPFIYNKFTDVYNDYIKIFIIRNPLWIYSSLNKRLNPISVER